MPTSINSDSARTVRPTAAGPTADLVWRELAKASFAVVSHVTPAGEPRSSGVVYARHRDSPQGQFLSYGLGISLAQMRNPAVARAHVPVA